ncbi:RRXRR domain-containing protein [Oscillatoria salina]|uniref:RRXRR domain-containing protein n=1 Tax=Oscillatoria salina TaxID=331517 RepID=UPI001CCD03B8|nr:RRXRR domain-containing protein [Oscillatoria salina]MBZ8178585.1 hypothetical protein [Oscillatoria salina IIICB1]
MLRVPVRSPDGKPLMPTKPSRARRWIRDGLAIGKWSDLGAFYVQLKNQPSGEKTQPIALGIDPGKRYSGVGVQSAKVTLFMSHLVLPFESIKDRMEQRRMMRRGRRGRRINRKIPYSQRAHRQVRFNNRRGNKLPPSIRANRQLELRVATELCRIYPISQIVYEYVKVDVDLTSGRKTAKKGVGFSPVMVGQKWMIKHLSKLSTTSTLYGWETAAIRQQLGLIKEKKAKSKRSPETHAVDGISLASSQFVRYRQLKGRLGWWDGFVSITPAPFIIIRRPPVSRRQLHLMIPTKGGKRRKYGGTTTRHGFRKGDLVKAEKAGRISIGWVSGDTQKLLSVSDINWKRLGQFSASKVQLLCRATGLLVSPQVICQLLGHSTPVAAIDVVSSPTWCAPVGVSTRIFLVNTHG